jgi:DNA repair protein RecO (recombination protein O)
MLHKTKGIALHQIKYSDTSIVAYVYTELFGRQAYLIKGAHKKDAAIRAGLFQPLYLLDLEVSHKPSASLNKLKEAVNLPVYSTVPFNSAKTAISLFLAEVLYRTIREEATNKNLFGFIYHSAQMLDIMDVYVADFHLIFLMQFSKFLGFYPSNNFSSSDNIFDLVNGRFVNIEPAHGYYIEKQFGKSFADLIELSFENISKLKLTNLERREILARLIDFYKCHVEGMGNIKSLQILSDVFR